MCVASTTCFLAVALASGAAFANDGPVVGTEEATLFLTHELENETATLTAGTKVTVEQEREDALQIRTENGKQGWVRRCYLCTPSEFQRRRRADEVPKSVICIRADDQGRTSLYGTLPVRNGRFVLEAGQAFWMDESARGASFGLNKNRIVGDPEVLFLYTQEDRVARLPIWTSAGGRSPSNRGLHAGKGAGVERVWTDATGKYTIKAAFLGLKGLNVQLKKQDGRIISVPMEKLSRNDRLWIATVGARNPAGAANPSGASKRPATTASTPRGARNPAGAANPSGASKQPATTTSTPRSKEAIRLATIRKAEELELSPVVVYKRTARDSVGILKGSRMTMKNGETGFGDNSLITNAGAYEVPISGRGWSHSLKRAEFLVIRDGKLTESGLVGGPEWNRLEK